MPKDKRKICVWVPDDLYNNVVKVGSVGPTSAVTKGLEALWTFDEWKQRTNYKWKYATNDGNYFSLKDYLDSRENNLINNSIEDNNDLLAENKELKNEIKILNEALQKAPDPVELAELQTNLKGLQRLLEEKDKRIEDLTKAVDILNVFANYFKKLS
jgi:hypothetical protein